MRLSAAAYTSYKYIFILSFSALHTQPELVEMEALYNTDRHKYLLHKASYCAARLAEEYRVLDTEMKHKPGIAPTYKCDWRRFCDDVDTGEH